MRRGGGQEMTPEDIFQAFFGGGMPGGMPGGGGGPGMHFYSSGFGPSGMHFRAGGPQQQQRRGPADPAPALGFGMLVQMLPLLLFMILSFLSQSDSTQNASARPMAGENQYFSLTVSVVPLVVGMMDGCCAVFSRPS